MRYASVSLKIQTHQQKAPQEIVLIPSGSPVMGRDGRTFLNSDPKAFIERTKARGVDLPIDENHSSDQWPWMGCPALGWIKELRLDDQGQVVGSVEWTDEGRSYIETKKYRYISPTFPLDPKTNEILFLLGAALTNRPNLQLPALNSQSNIDHKKEIPMKEILKLLGLSDDATEEVALNAIAQLKAKQVMTQSVDLTQYAPRGDMKMMEERALKAEKALEALQKNTLDTKAQEVVHNAMKMGKISPASKEAYLALCSSEEGLKKCIKILEDSAPVISQNSEISNSMVLSENLSLNSDESLISKLGYSKEQWKKVVEASK